MPSPENPDAAVELYAGGAWLGAGPEGVRQGAAEATSKDGSDERAVERAGGAARLDEATAAMCSAAEQCAMAAALTGARATAPSAPCGASAIRTAAHAAAIEPRIPLPDGPASVRR